MKNIPKTISGSSNGSGLGGNIAKWSMGSPSLQVVFSNSEFLVFNLTLMDKNNQGLVQVELYHSYPKIKGPFEIDL